MADKQRTIIRRIIVILSLLLAASLLALAVILAGKYIFADSSTVVQVPDNLIGDSSLEGSAPNDSSSLLSEDASKDISSSTVSRSDEDVAAVVLSLNSSIYGDNLPFNITNMFPGDSLTQYYCIRTSFQDIITLNFETEITGQSKKLADALRVSVSILGESEPLYKGAFADMPVLQYKLSSAQAVTKDVYFIIDVYLPTSVGNDYQNRRLTVDFNWYVSEIENLKPAPPTGGDGVAAFPFAVVAILSICGLAILCLIARKEVPDEQ